MKNLKKNRSFLKVEIAGLLGVKVPCLMPIRVKDFMADTCVVSLNDKESTTKPILKTTFLMVKYTLFYDLTRDSIANNFVINFYCRCLQILYQIAIYYKT